MKKLVAVLAVLTMLAGCGSKVELIPHQEAHAYDKDTNFSIQEESDGFMLTVDYGKPAELRWLQPGLGLTGPGTRECKAKLISIARELSDKAGRKIKPINEESITVSLTHTGATDDANQYFHAQVKVAWE
jgi:predicted small lipoprotein YifL